MYDWLNVMTNRCIECVYYIKGDTENQYGYCHWYTGIAEDKFLYYNADYTELPLCTHYQSKNDTNLSD